MCRYFSAGESLDDDGSCYPLIPKTWDSNDDRPEAEEEVAPGFYEPESLKAIFSTFCLGLTVELLFR